MSSHDDCRKSIETADFNNKKKLSTHGSNHKSTKTSDLKN